MSPVGGSALYASASGSGSLSRLPVKSSFLVKALTTSASLLSQSPRVYSILSNRKTPQLREQFRSPIYVSPAVAEAHWLCKPPRQFSLVYRDDQPPPLASSWRLNYPLRECFLGFSAPPCYVLAVLPSFEGRISQAKPQDVSGALGKGSHRRSSNPLPSSCPPHVTLPDCLRAAPWEGSEKSCHEVRDQLVSQPSQSAGQTGGGPGEQMVPSVPSPQLRHPVVRHADWLRGPGPPSAGLSDG